jgi:hypothetical protein
MRPGPRREQVPTLDLRSQMKNVCFGSRTGIRSRSAQPSTGSTIGTSCQEGAHRGAGERHVWPVTIQTMARHPSRPSGPLTNVQRFRLIGQSKRWADFVSRIDEDIAGIPFRRGISPVGPPPGLPLLDLVYVQVLALSHVAACLRWLKDDGFPVALRGPAGAFLRLAADITSLRGLMEHEDEYIVTGGMFPERVGAPDGLSRGDDGQMHPMHGWGVTTNREGIVEEVRFLGKDYALVPAKEALRGMTPVLNDIVRGLSDYRH